jgi:uncharacterized protein (TIGR02246 family)
MRLASLGWIAVLAGGLVIAALGQTPPAKDGTAKSDKDDKDAEILEPIERLAKAFNARDAKGIAAAWTDNAELIDEDTDERLEGRAAIVADYAASLAKAQEFRIEIDVVKVRRHTADAATVEGEARVLRPKEPISRSTFVAVLVRHNGAWRLDSVRERGIEAADSNAEFLKDLAWLNGVWRHQDEDTEVQLESSEAGNGNFRVQRFRVKAGDEITHEGTQIIGYDASKKQLRSWVFSSDGSFGEGVVEQKGDRFTIRVVGVLPDGDKSSATQITMRKGDNEFTYQVVDRHFGTRSLPDVPAITLTKVAAPATTAEKED